MDEKHKPTEKARNAYASMVFLVEATKLVRDIQLIVLDQLKDYDAVAMAHRVLDLEDRIESFDTHIQRILRSCHRKLPNESSSYDYWIYRLRRERKERQKDSAEASSHVKWSLTGENKTDEDLLLARQLAGKIVSDLTYDEFVIFERLLEKGLVERAFDGPFGLYGVATIGLTSRYHEEMKEH
jgi:hypothetical protein